MEITLEELLASRDNRRQKQGDLIDHYGKPLISLTVVMPGPVKKNELTAIISSSAIKIIRDIFGPYLITETEYDLHTGFEALYVVSINKEKAKEIACSIEDEHPWGRLFDIDIIGEDKQPMSREQVGRKPRKCLVCEEDAHICMRNRTHSLKDVMSAIEWLVNK